MRKVYDSVNSGDGVAAARGKQARIDIMVRLSCECCARCCCCVMRLPPQDKYTPEAVASDMEKRVQVRVPQILRPLR
jgi:hypothetical protein